MISYPNAKINLGLYVTRKRSDGFHDLATIFYPLPLCDALEVITNEENDFSITISGIEIKGERTENLCSKAFQLIKKDFPQIPDVKMYLHKTIPIGAGLGGGSADGAFALQLLNNKYQLHLSQNQLMKYALQLGSDCPFFIYNQPCIATGRGEILEEIKIQLSGYYIVLVYPKIHINTGWAFAQMQPKPLEISLQEIAKLPIDKWKDFLKNDFENSVFEQYPAIQSIKEKMYAQGAAYASMTGSGSSVYGIFREKKELSDFGFDKNYFQFEATL